MARTLLILLTGAGATATMDLWTLLRRRLFGTPLPNYAFVGRWLGRMVHGEFRQVEMTRVTPVRGERAIGWASHYLIGIAFAFLLPAFWGHEWTTRPALSPALVIGLGTVLVPWLLMQPAMGAGIASSRAPRPGAARLQSFINHAIFGFGLYLSALMLNRI